MRKRTKYRPQKSTKYTMFDEIAASPTQPLPLLKRDYQLGLIQTAIEAMRTAEAPNRNHWDAICDCVNLLETLVREDEINDDGGWIAEASREMALAAKRHREGKVLRLTGTGLQAVMNAFEGYEMAVNSLPARTIVRTHRLTEIHVRDILAGKRLRGQQDIEVVAL